MTTAQAAVLAASPVITLGAHAMEHPAWLAGALMR
jgi:hypothetical protein